MGFDADAGPQQSPGKRVSKTEIMMFTDIPVLTPTQT